MSAVRVLVLGSYPTVRPIHGGQIRLAEIVAAYRARGFDVRQANAYPDNPLYRSRLSLRRREKTDALDLPLPPETLGSHRGLRAPFIEDLVSGEVLAADGRRLAAIEAHCAGSVHWVHVEQPWLLPAVQRLRQRGALGDFRLVYGSQNIEHALKRDIFRQYGVEGDELLDAIEALERQAAREADVVAAVTREDARWLASESREAPLLAPNGVRRWSSVPEAKARWRARLGEEPFALYVASAHPPNVIGFCESFGECLAALSPTQRVVLAGSVAEHVVSSEWFRRWGPLNERRTQALGVLDAGDLDAVKDLAHAFVVPVTRGGGSNLKTAEALYSARNVVATPYAMRGFEHLSDLPGLVIAEPGAAFARAVHEALSREAPAADDDVAARRETLAWHNTLASLVDALGTATEAVPA
ncbi:MAG TPA: hypothetical protein VGE10_11455 [Zeimonas sp.]